MHNQKKIDLCNRWMLFSPQMCGKFNVENEGDSRIPDGVNNGDRWGRETHRAPHE